jgi:hypothetical protein
MNVDIHIYLCIENIYFIYHNHEKLMCACMHMCVCERERAYTMDSGT